MKTKNSQPQARFYIQMTVKALFIFTGLFVLGSFTTARAQKRSILLSPINFQQGCPSLDESVVQVSIDGVQMVSRGPTSVSPGSRSLSVTTSKVNNLTIKEIRYEDWESSPGAANTPRIQTFEPKTPDATESITVYNPNTSAPARLSITVACGAAAAPQQRVPIIFLPGVAGTALKVEGRGYLSYIRNPQVWPAGEGDRTFLALADDGKAPAYPDRKIIVGTILGDATNVPLYGATAPPTGMNFYGGLLAYLINNWGYVRDTNLFVFPYDWRLDNATHFTALDEAIDNALKLNPNAKKVILIAHSMGGYIARGYLIAKPGQAAKVESLITMGTPYWGAPKPYYGLVSGYQFGNDTVNQNLMKLLVQNFPAAYQLSPNYPFIEEAGTKRMLTLKESNTLIYKGFVDVTENKVFKDDYQESSDNRWVFNPKLLQIAEAFNKSFSTNPDAPPEKPTPLPGGVKQYVIIGVGVKTLAQYSMRDARPGERFVVLIGKNVVLEPRFGDGDGTVPLQGSEISSNKKVAEAMATTYYIPNGAQSSGHADLPSNTIVQEIVGNIINGRPPKTDTYKNPNEAEDKRIDLEKGAQFALHSDAHLNITDERTGRKLGFNNKGGIDENLPSGTFLSMEGVEYASIADIDRTIRVRVTGIREGKFTLDVNVNRAGSTVAQFSYREVPVKPGTIAEVTMTPGQMSTPPPLTVTTNGRTTTIPASMGNGGGPLIPQGGAQIPTGPIITPPSNGGIGGTWVTTTGDTIILTQTGNRVTGSYRGGLGTGTVTGTFDGRTFSGTIEAGQMGIVMTDTFSLRLTPEGRLEGQVGSTVFKVDVILNRR